MSGMQTTPHAGGTVGIGGAGASAGTPKRELTRCKHVV